MTADPLRPASLDEFQGQEDITGELRIVLKAAKARGEVPPHVLLSGPPGLGKTTLAAIIAHEAGLPFVATSAPALEKPGDLVAVLVSLDQPSVVFVDEIHQLPRAVEETLYSAMEDGRIDIVVAEGTTKARVIRMPIEPFTLVGATTQAGSLGGPFRDRFGHSARLRPYDVPTLASIIVHNAKTIGLPVTEEAAEAVAGRSRGTPRVANRLLRRTHDWATVANLDHVTADDVANALDAFGIDPAGLDRVDRAILKALCVDFGGGPVGLSTLAASTGEAEITIEQAHEPFLMRSGLMARTTRGRVATRAAYVHQDLPVPAHLADTEDTGPAGRLF